MLYLIRALEAEDLPALEALVAELQDHERTLDGHFLPGAVMAGPYTADLLRRSALEEGAVLLAEVEGAIAGFVAVQARVVNDALDEPEGSYALLSDLAVAEGRRGQGLGKALLRAAEEHARRCGAEELRIPVLSRNLHAKSLYASLGFSPYYEVLTKRLKGE